jgi:amino-acid N-acetyltransferase
MTTKIPAASLRSAVAADLPELEALLDQASLSSIGVAEALDHFVVAVSEGRVVGTVGLEVYDSDGLLRSAAVDATLRGAGIGQRLVERILADAVGWGIRTVYLLTTTAERWFQRFGFEPTSRAEVPEAVKSSVEFREICPASAAVMMKRLR